MNEASQQGIKFSSPARRCPYCHDSVGHSDTKCVCNSCLAVSHEACWDEARCCPSCKNTDRLVQEKGAGESSNLPLERRRRGSIRDEEYELAPQVKAIAKGADLSSCLQQVRDSERYQEVLTIEGQNALRDKAYEQISLINDPSTFFSGDRLMTFAMAVLVASFLILALGDLSTVVVGPALFGFLFYLANMDNTLKRELKDALFVPIAVKVLEKSRVGDHGLQHLVCELDPQSDVELEAFHPIHEDKEQRLLGVDVPADMCGGVKVGEVALLVSYKKKILVFEAMP